MPTFPDHALALRFRIEQFVQPDIDLAGRSDMADFKTVGLETILQQPDFLGADDFLHPVRNDEAGGRRPDMAGWPKVKSRR